MTRSRKVCKSIVNRCLFFQNHRDCSWGGSSFKRVNPRPQLDASRPVNVPRIAVGNSKSKSKVEITNKVAALRCLLGISGSSFNRGYGFPCAGSRLISKVEIIRKATTAECLLKRSCNSFDWGAPPTSAQTTAFFRLRLFKI